MIRTHARAVALVAVAFLLAALIGVQAARAQPAQPAGKVEDGPLAKPAAAALYVPLASEPEGKVRRGPIEK